MSATPIGILLGLLAAVLVGAVFIWRLKADLDRTDFWVVVVMLGFTHVVGLIVWLMKGFSITSFLVMLAVAYACVLVATWGRPGEFYRLMLDPDQRWSKRNWLVQMRFVLVVLVAVCAGLPFLVRIV